MSKIWTGVFVAAAAVSVVSFVSARRPTAALPQQQAPPKPPDVSDQKPEPQESDPQEPDPQKPDPKKQKKPQPQKPQPQRQGQPPPAQTRQPQGQPQSRQPQPRLAQPQQQVLIGQQQQRFVQYGAHLDAQIRLAPQQVVVLQQQNRPVQYGIQMQYLAHLREQQAGMQSSRDYDYGRDPYFYTAPQYRYFRGGRYYETNEYGATILRRAVNYGYEEGYRTGEADRQDHWAFNFQDSYAYRDGNYGYAGFYIERDDYNYYFREGFRRGYDDGYYTRHAYGVFESGQYAMQGPVLSVILSLQPIR